MLSLNFFVMCIWQRLQFHNAKVALCATSCATGCQKDNAQTQRKSKKGGNVEKALS